MDKIAVIIPVFNSEPWLLRCLDSVSLAADDNTHIYVIDDGSDDMSPVIAKNFAKTHRNVTVLNQQHLGPGAARCLGVTAAADAEWICFVDSDDSIPTDSIRNMRLYATNDVDIVSGNVNIRSNDGNRHLDDKPKRYLNSSELAIELLESRMIGVIYGKLIRRELFDRIDWDTHPSLTNHEDVMLMINLACAMQRRAIIVSSILTYNYIRRPDSLSTVLYFKHEGIQRLWDNVKKLDVPRKSLVRWGLGIINTSFIDRGIEFPNSYPPARELRQLSRGIKLGRMYRPVAMMLYSAALRRWVMRRRMKNGELTNLSPHISFITVVHNDIHGLRRTLRSIFNTGFRNIEIIVVDDGSSPECSIRINELHVKFRRIQLIKTPKHIGASPARALAVKQSKALCTMFLNPGDTICRQGVYNAVSHIDHGADLAICGRRNASVFYHTKTFDPNSYKPELENVDERIFDHLLDNYYYEAPLGGIIIRRSIFTDDDFPPSDDYTTSHVHELLTRVSLQLRPQRYALISELGYNQALSARQYLRPVDRWNRDLHLAYHMLNLLIEADASDLYPKVITGMRRAFVRSYSRIAGNPFRSKATLRRMINDGLNHPLLAECHHMAGTNEGFSEANFSDREHYVETLAAEATAIARKYPWYYLRFFILKH